MQTGLESLCEKLQHELITFQWEWSPIKWSFIYNENLHQLIIMKKEIVIIGGGFAGINMARKLKNENGIHVTLVDKNNYNFFTPLLYQVATGMLDVSSISTPFRTLLKKAKNFDFRLGELQTVNPEDNKIQLSTGELSYDSLVIATGTKANFFGMDNIEQNALPMKTIDDAVNMQ